MPLFIVCNTPFVAAEEVWEAATRPPGAGDVIGIICLAAPFCFGALSAIVSLRGRHGRFETDRSLGWSIAVLIGTVVVACSIAFSAHLVNHGLDLNGYGDGVFLLIVLASLAYFVRGLRAGPGGLLCIRWYAALSSLAFLLCILVASGDALYGLWVALLGSLIALVGLTGEARLRCRRTVAITVWNLVRCQVRVFPLQDNRCHQCDYDLRGTTSQCCPECGQPTLAGLDPSPPPAEAQEKSRPEMGRL
jgi:hypothetical protein